MSVGDYAAVVALLFIFIAVGVLMVLMTRMARMERFLADHAARAEERASARQDALEDGLLDSQLRHGDRVIGQAVEAAERLRLALGGEILRLREGMQAMQLSLHDLLNNQRGDLGVRLADLAAAMQGRQDQLRQDLLQQTLGALAEHARADRELLQGGLQQASKQLADSIDLLSRAVDERLERIGGVVNQRLDEGFRQTNETFVSVMARLATIDEAQKKIDGLTSNVVSLQELLGDKRARGAFGEVQLEALVRNLLPPGSYAFQYTLPNNCRADCVLHLPEPTGTVAVDAKFPLENYRRMCDPGATEAEERAARSAFRADMRRHVDAIASRYLIPGVTADGAVMFVPAEAVFAEVHAHHPEVVAYAQQRRVWIVSPTTLMAVLNTARAVLKDVEMRRQVHLIRDALASLSRDFARFDERMHNLARHIEQANRDVQEVRSAGKRISSQFARIEAARLDESPDAGCGDDDSRPPPMKASET